MKTIKLTNAETRLIVNVLEGLVNDDEKETYLANGDHPQYRRSVFLSDAHCAKLSAIAMWIGEM